MLVPRRHAGSSRAMMLYDLSDAQTAEALVPSTPARQPCSATSAATAGPPAGRRRYGDGGHPPGLPTPAWAASPPSWPTGKAGPGGTPPGPPPPMPTGTTGAPSRPSPPSPSAAKGTIYLSFASKEEVFQALAQRLSQQCRSRASLAPPRTGQPSRPPTTVIHQSPQATQLTQRKKHQPRTATIEAAPDLLVH